MRYFAKDSFDMPHNQGIKAIIERLDMVVFDRNLFGGFDARIYTDDSDDPQEVAYVAISIEDPWIRNKIGVDGYRGATITDEDVLLWCERAGEYVKWYKVTYEYSNETNQCGN